MKGEVIQVADNPNTDRVWFITGCSSGMGRALAQLLIEVGGKGVITARKVDHVKDLQERSGNRLKPVCVDITKLADVKASVEFALVHFGRIDVLVNNAAVGHVGAIEEHTDAEIARVFDTNLFGTLNVIRAVLPHFRRERGGRIITLTSLGGFRGRAGVAFYNGSKFALEGIHEALADEVRPFGVGVTIVQPGNFKTNFRSRGIVSANTVIDDYSETVGRLRKVLGQPQTETSGDPSQIAAAIMALVESGLSPMRMAVGADVIEGMHTKIEAVSRELAEWEHVGMLAGTGGRATLDEYIAAIGEIRDGLPR